MADHRKVQSYILQRVRRVKIFVILAITAIFREVVLLMTPRNTAVYQYHGISVTVY